MKSAERAIDIAKKLGEKITALYVVDTGCAKLISAIEGFEHLEEESLTLGLEKKGEKNLEKIEDIAKKEGLEFKKVIKKGDPAEEIVKLSREINSDLIVMGSVGARLNILGSVSEKVVKNADCSVLVVR